MPAPRPDAAQSRVPRAAPRRLDRLGALASRQDLEPEAAEAAEPAPATAASVAGSKDAAFAGRHFGRLAAPGRGACDYGSVEADCAPAALAAQASRVPYASEATTAYSAGLAVTLCAPYSAAQDAARGATQP